MPKFRRYLFIGLLLLLASSLSASEIPIRIVGDKTLGIKDFSLGLIIDSSRSMQVEDVAKLQHRATIINSRYSIPSIKFDYWFIVKLHNPDSTVLVQNVGLDEPSFEIADIYYPDGDNWHHERNGLQVPIADRTVKHRWPIFEVKFLPGETKTIYLKMHSKYLIPVGVISENTSVFEITAKRQLMGYWFYFGAAISILLYNLFLFFQVKDRAYLLYVCYVFFLLIFIFLYSGFFLSISSSMKLFYFLSVGAPLMGAFIALFSRELLNTRTTLPLIDKILRVTAIVYLILAILVGIDISFYQYIGSISIFSTLFLLLVGIYSLTKKVPLANYYIIASGPYIVGLFLIAGLTINIIPYSGFARYGFIGGSFIELSVFSLALGYKIKLLQLEKIKFQNEVIETERSMKKNLEAQVQERTQELSIQIKENEKVIEALKKSDLALQKSNEAKDKLFSIIAHDLKGPFNSILGFLNLLKDGYYKYSDEKRVKMIHNISVSSNTAYHLINNLLVWSRSQKNGIIFKPRMTDFNLLIDEIIETIYIQAESKELELVVEPNANPEIFVDPEMLKIVIRNLLSNAIKFTERGGIITISSQINPDNPEEILVSVRDTGLGIEAENIDKIFNLAKHESTQGTENEKGTGLGLILCKELIAKHKGKIWVESEFGKGSCFSFSLPWR